MTSLHETASTPRITPSLIASTIALHGAMMVANELFFRRAEFLQGIGWIYLPAGTRLLCTLLFGEAGAIGLLISGWLATYFYYFPGDVLRSTMGSFSGAIGPYLVYLVAQRRWGLRASLAGLTARRLLWCALGCAIASPLLHHVWFILHGEPYQLAGFLVMFTGDLAGTLLVVYAGKGALAYAKILSN